MSKSCEDCKFCHAVGYHWYYCEEHDEDTGLNYNACSDFVERA